jgi:trimethylamine---corrinoid protein Co-methyltransferase
VERQYFRILSDEDMHRIHDSSLAILENTGLLVEHEKAKGILYEAGAKVDHKSYRVRFPPELVEKSLKTIPRKIVYAGRDPEFDMTLEAEGNLYTRTTTGETTYVDLKTGEYRRAKIADMKEFAKLADALPNIDCCGALYTVDVPVQTSDVHAIKVLLEAQRKPFVFQ